MAAHLEAHPDARAVVNFSPVLLEQIETYLFHIERWRQDGQIIGDPLLAALVNPVLPDPGSPAFLELMENALEPMPTVLSTAFLSMPDWQKSLNSTGTGQTFSAICPASSWRTFWCGITWAGWQKLFDASTVLCKAFRKRLTNTRWRIEAHYWMLSQS